MISNPTQAAINRDVFKYTQVKNAMAEMLTAMIEYVVGVMRRVGISEDTERAVVESIRDRVPKSLDYKLDGLDEWWHTALEVIEEREPSHLFAFADDRAGAMLMCERKLEMGDESLAEVVEQHHAHRVHLLLADQPDLADEVCKWADLSNGNWRCNAANALLFRDKSDEALLIIEDPLREVQLQIIEWRYAIQTALKQELAKLH